MYMYMVRSMFNMQLDTREACKRLFLRVHVCASALSHTLAPPLAQVVFQGGEGGEGGGGLGTMVASALTYTMCTVCYVTCYDASGF